jgi:hypothetical protein
MSIYKIKIFIVTFFFCRSVLNGNLSKMKKIFGPDRFHIMQVLQNYENTYKTKLIHYINDSGKCETQYFVIKLHEWRII